MLTSTDRSIVFASLRQYVAWSQIDDQSAPSTICR